MKTKSKPSFPENVWRSEHFNLYQLAEGVYAAIATELGAAFSNAGLIDLGERTLVFDATQNVLAAEDLLQASLQLTLRKPATVILSHWHPDHWNGMQVFADCTILATPATRRAMLPIAREMERDAKNCSRLEKQLREVEAQLAAATDPKALHILQLSVNRLRYDLQALPNLKPTLPNQTFEGTVTFHGTARTAELISTGKGHTVSDCILHLPKDRIAFIGDLGFFQSQPFMPYGSPPEWLALLDQLAGGKATVFVPGHGPLGGKKDLLLEAQYINALEHMVRQVIRRGGMLRDALRQTLPPPFDAWQLVGHRFEANVRASFRRQRSPLKS